MMSCGVTLERLPINDLDTLLASTALLKDKSCDSVEPSTDQQTSVDVPTHYDTENRDARKACKKSRVQTTSQQNDSSNACVCNNASLTAELRLTLKKVKVENGTKDEDACLYVCHTKKSTASKKLLNKSAVRNSSVVDKKPTRAAKHDSGLTDSGKVANFH